MAKKGCCWWYLNDIFEWYLNDLISDIVVADVGINFLVTKSSSGGVIPILEKQS